MDKQWWDVHLAEVKASFRGELLSRRNIAGVRDARVPVATSNSGAGAIALAASRGARRILLAGYDAQHTGGQRHWHGNHPAGCAGNAGPKTVAKWPAQFRDIRNRLANTDIINCSRATALTVFPRVQLEEALSWRA